MTYPRTAGVILAGGLARRLGGGDKGLHAIGGRPILLHVLDRLAPQCGPIALNANDDPARFATFGLPVVADGVPGRPGPLAGILAGLDWLAGVEPGCAWLVSVAGDTPFLPEDLVGRLHAARAASGSPLASAASGGRTHPVVGLWPVSLREALRRAIVEEGTRKVGRWVADQGAALAEWPAGPPDPFFNVNTPEDLAEARRLAGEDQTSDA